MTKLVSIITPMYNSEKTIVQMITSVIEQTYKNWELLIADDLSTDHSVELVEEFVKKDSRIKLLRTEINTGPAESRNRSISVANGEYIAFLDSDDTWSPDKLKTQVKLLQQPNIFFVYSSYELMNDKGQTYNKQIFVPSSATYTQLLKSNYIPCLTVMYDCKELGKYYMKKIGHEDYVCWLDILKTGTTAYGIKDVLAQYRVHSNTVSSNKLKIYKYQWNIYRNELKLDLLRSSYYFIWYTIKGLKKHFF